MEPLRHGAALSRATSIAAGTADGTLLVQGEPGIGKSHLLACVADAVDLTTVTVRINPAECGIALSGLSGVLAGLRREGVADVRGRFVLRSGHPSQLFAAAHELIGLLRGLALGPTVLLLDDVDRADPQSQSVLGIVAHRLGGTGLRLVMTATRLPPDTPFAATPTIELSPMPVAELVALGEGLAPDADGSTLRILAWFSGGNPRVLVESLRLIDHEQLTGAGWLIVPPRFNDALGVTVAPLIASLTGQQRRVLDRLALAPLTPVGAIADAGVDTADVVEDLLDDGTLRREGPFIGFTDRRLRSYIYWSSDTHSRRTLHAALERSHLPHSRPLAIWHRSFATYGRTGVDDLLSGAAELVTLHRREAAVELAERALRKAERIEDHVDAVMNLCDHLLRSGDVALAARYSSRIRPDAVQPGHALRLASFNLVAQMFRARRIAEDEVRTLVGLYLTADPEGAARLLTLAAGFMAERWENAEARRLLESFPELRGRVGRSTAALLTTTQAALDALEGAPTADGALPRSAQRGTPSPPELVAQGRLMTHLERHDEARLLLNTVLNHPRPVDRIWADLAHYALIDNEIAAGLFHRARGSMEAWADDSPWISRRSAMYAYLDAWRANSLGQTAEASALIDLCLELASQEGSPAARAKALALRAALALREGDPESAMVALRQVSGFVRQFRNPATLRHWADHVEACHATGRHQEAEGVVLVLDRQVASCASRWGELALARCRAIIAPDDTALPTFEAALGLFRAGDSPYERGRTLSAMATRQDALGLSHDARRTRGLMLEAFERAGARGWPERELAQHADPRDERGRLSQLTPEEVAIARQVQAGLRNREIAESLYVSVRTVELRLTHIYRTLGVRSRSHLVAALGRLESPADREDPQGAPS